MTLSDTQQNVSIITCTWSEYKDELRGIRETVFIEEQHVPVDLEWDTHDQDALHLLVRDSNQQAIATARMLSDGHIGRMAVLKPWRKQGIGTAMLRTLIRICQDKQLIAHLDAQVHAIGFYTKLGFVTSGDVFIDAGIPHKRMYLAL